jgi:hypothetical protein
MCKDCSYRVSRIISLEGLELYDQEGEVLDMEGECEFIHELCSLLHVELDHIVVDCSGYKSKYNAYDNFFSNKNIIG